MKSFFTILLFLFGLGLAKHVHVQTADVKTPNRQWNAHWIGAPYDAGTGLWRLLFPQKH
jgi:hypothetical protein